MACCGQQRAAVVQGKTSSAQTSHNGNGSVAVRFTQSKAVMVRGPVTGRHYQFNGSTQSQHVDGRDAAALLKSGYFQRA